MDDLIKSIKAALYDRLGNPFFGSFIFSWLVINWQIPYILFIDDDSLSLLERVKTIENNHISPLTLFITPFLFSLFYVFAYPYFTSLVLKSTTKFRNRHSEIVDQESAKRVLSIEESLKINQEMLKVKKENEDLFEQKNNLIEDLNMENKKIVQEIDTFKREIEKLNKQIQQKDDLINNEIKEKNRQQKNNETKTKTISDIKLPPSALEHKFNKVLKSNRFSPKEFKNISDRILRKLPPRDDSNLDLINLLISYDFISDTNIRQTGSDYPVYEFTKEGKSFLQHILENEELNVL